jgi:hypothetical protein
MEQLQQAFGTAGTGSHLPTLDRFREDALAYVGQTQQPQ